MPDASLGSGDVTTLPGSPAGQFASTSPNSTVQELSPNVYQLHFDVSAPGSFAEVFANYNPLNDGSSADLSSLSQIVFGLDSDKAGNVKIELEDASGKRATFYAQNVDVSRNYYKFLASSVAGSIDLAHVTALHVVVDGNSVAPGNEVGDLRIEIGGLV